jgi:hypothetical protein
VKPTVIDGVENSVGSVRIYCQVTGGKGTMCPKAVSGTNATRATQSRNIPVQVLHLSELSETATMSRSIPELKDISAKKLSLSLTEICSEDTEKVVLTRSTLEHSG